MIKVKFNIRTLIDMRDNRVLVRVRWNQKANEVGFVTGMYADVSKWDFVNQKALKSTVHEIKGKKFPAYEINERIDELCNVIPKVFAIYEMNNSVPSSNASGIS